MFTIGEDAGVTKVEIEFVFGGGEVVGRQIGLCWFWGGEVGMVVVGEAGLVF